MIDLKILRCPESGQELKKASQRRINALNKKREESGKIDGGFETLDKNFLYPTRNKVTSFLLTDRIKLT